MPRLVHLLTLAACLLLAACSQAARPDLPDPGRAVVPQVQIVERIVYVPIDSALVGREPVAEGPLSMCPQVAAERKAALLRCNARLEQIEQIQATRQENPRP